MRKFEIINNKWIKEIIFDKSMQHVVLHAWRLSEIIQIFCTSNSKTGGEISLRYNGGTSINFRYSVNEEEDFKKDLAFLEELLFN